MISDIHGCLLTLEALLGKLDLRDKDLLVFLGDYVDRGPDSAGVLNRVKELIEHRPFTYGLRGNHEEMLLDTLQAGKDWHAYVEPNLEILQTATGEFDREMHQFLAHLPYYLELPNHYLVHAGFNFNCPYPFSDTYSMVWIRNFSVDRNQISNKQLVVGHTPTPILQIEMEITSRAAVIHLDNGCVFSAHHLHYGKLLALELTDQVLYLQENIDF